jgi:hypothetical protein
LAAQTATLAKAENDAADALSAAAPEPIQAEVAAAAAKERRGDKSDDTMPGDDLEAVVKFVHKKVSTRADYGPVSWTGCAPGKSADFPGLKGNPLPVVHS